MRVCVRGKMQLAVDSQHSDRSSHARTRREPMARALAAATAASSASRSAGDDGVRTRALGVATAIQRAPMDCSLQDRFSARHEVMPMRTHAIFLGSEVFSTPRGRTDTSDPHTLYPRSLRRHTTYRPTKSLNTTSKPPAPPPSPHCARASHARGNPIAEYLSLRQAS